MASDPCRAGGVASDRGLTRARSLGGCLAGQTPDATRRRPIRAQLLSPFFPKACVKPLPKQQGHQAHGSHRSRRQRACGAREAGRAGAARAERPAQLAQEARSAPRLGRAKTPVRCDEGGRRGRTQESSRASRRLFPAPTPPGVLPGYFTARGRDFWNTASKERHSPCSAVAMSRTGSGPTPARGGHGRGVQCGDDHLTVQQTETPAQNIWPQVPSKDPHVRQERR